MHGRAHNKRHTIAILVALTAAHFVVAFATDLVAFGWDLDQVRSRSPWSRAAAVLHDVLWFPHDPFMRAIPNAFFVRWHGLVTPFAIVLNSVVWAIAIYVIWRGIRRLRRDS